jgi:NADH:ubiquinone oxidoreductase subunit K
MPDILAGMGFVPGLQHWLILAAALFAVGVYGVLTRRSAVGVLMAVELLLNSAALTFVVFNRFSRPAAVDGQVMAIFVIAVAAAEVVVAMAIFVALYRVGRTVDLNRLDRLKNDEVER